MTPFRNKSLTRLGIALLFMAFSVTAAADNLENLALALAKIRGEVEELQTQLDQEKEAHHNRMEALSSQLTDLSVEQRRQTVAIEKMQQSLQKQRELSLQSQDSGQKLKPVLLQVLDDYEAYIAGGFPFKTEERLNDVTALHDQVRNDLLEPKKAANRMWAFIEDEIRLSKENGIYQQTIDLNGDKVLADVAKLGSVLLYFQTRDNQFGMAKQQPSGKWLFVTTDDRDDQERIELLFESLKKQIRQGYFELPNPLKS